MRTGTVTISGKHPPLSFTMDRGPAVLGMNCSDLIWHRRRDVDTDFIQIGH